MAGRLAERLKARIAATGPISVADYMAACLGDADDGYYMRRDPLGAAGDFTTAPEISQMFGELLGLWCAEVWRRAGAPAPVNLVELGPGRGTLMADALRAAAAAMPDFRGALAVHLVETSPTLRALQQSALADAAPHWHDGLETVPAGPALILANEFFDALPVRQFQRAADDWRERLVTIDAEGGGFAFTLAARPGGFDGDSHPALAGAAVGAIAETCPAALDLAGRIGRRLNRDVGAALIVDYGPAARAPGDSLQAVKAHAYHPVLADPGAADLTAHVDFESLLGAAAAAGAGTFGPVTQGALLARLGIRERLQRLLAGADADRQAALLAAHRRLTDGDEMGSLFKAVAFVGLDSASPPPPGFEEPPEPPC